MKALKREQTLIFKKTSEKLFFKSQKPHDDRLGSMSKSISYEEIEQSLSSNNNFIIAGYADDEGIKNNSGRIGARLAPAKIREFFYKMTPGPQSEQIHIFDIGDLDPAVCPLAERHEKASGVARRAYENNSKWIGLGGGHDYGYADVSAFIRACEQRPLIINFDAHLDVRATDQGINSGTPFYRILEEFSDIDLVQIGIQSQCNSVAHLKYSVDHKVEILNYDDLRLSGEELSIFCLKRLSHLMTKKRQCFLSIDIDSFSSAYAPGCSQSFATGLEPNEFFKFISILKSQNDVRGIGIYECSPPLDWDDHTSKLAALIMHKFIFGK